MKQLTKQPAYLIAFALTAAYLVTTLTIVFNILTK